MKHILKLTEWQSPTGQWHTWDVYAKWWYIPRMLNIPPCDFILLLKNKFKAINIRYHKENNYLAWDWENYSDCHKFTLWVNNEARKRSFFIE